MINGADLLIRDVLGDAKKVFMINDYQRHYVWQEHQIKDFLKDIERLSIRRQRQQDLVHFFGQIIYHQIGEPDRRERIEYEIIDGQQRLTTFMLYIAAINGICVRNREQCPTAANALSTQCMSFLKSADAGMTPKNKLTLSSVDKQYFETMIEGLSNAQEPPEPESDAPESHKNLFSAQKTIRNHINESIANCESPELIISRLQESINTSVDGFQIVSIKTIGAEYTYQLYQVVNDRGESLHDGELLKAKSAEVLDGHYLFNEAIRMWDDILKDTGKTTDEYLKWAYMSLTGKVPASERFYNDFLKDYFGIFPDTIVTDNFKQEFYTKLQGLYKDIKLCRKLSTGIWPYPEDPNNIVKQWQKEILINLVVKGKHTLCIPVLLSAYHQPTHRGLSSEENFAKCLELCENCFVLIKLVCSWREDKFKDKYLSACVSLRTNPQGYRWQQFRETLSTISFNEIQRVCRNNLNTLVYKPKAPNSQIKYLLILLERYFDCFENGNLYPARISDGFTLVNNELSIEHIYAESARPEEYDQNIEKVKHTLGNLLIYGRRANTELKDKSYADKRPKYASAPFRTAQYISAQYDSWTHDNYIEYHDKTCGMLEKILFRFYSN